MLKKRILIGLVIGHFMVIIIYNTLSLVDAITVVYGGGQPAEDDSSALAALRKSIHFHPVHNYARVSGAETGFAFFAPQVGSQYISHFNVYDAEDKLLASYRGPQLSQRESMHRYAAFLDLFQEMIVKGKSDDHFDRRYARAILKSMAQRIGKRIDGATKVESIISVYKHPRFSNNTENTINKKQSASLVKLLENTIDLKAYE